MTPRDIARQKVAELPAEVSERIAALDREKYELVRREREIMGERREVLAPYADGRREIDLMLSVISETERAEARAEIPMTAPEIEIDGMRAWVWPHWVSIEVPSETTAGKTWTVYVVKEPNVLADDHTPIICPCRSFKFGGVCLHATRIAAFIAAETRKAMERVMTMSGENYRAAFGIPDYSRTVRQVPGHPDEVMEVPPLTNDQLWANPLYGDDQPPPPLPEWYTRPPAGNDTLSVTAAPDPPPVVVRGDQLPDHTDEVVQRYEQEQDMRHDYRRPVDHDPDDFTEF